MRLQYRHQKFQADAARAVVDVFAGQPYLTPTYMMDRGSGNYQIGVNEERDFTGFSNQRIVPELSDQRILEQLNKIQRANQIKPSDKLEGREGGYNLTIGMETGVGKTYTYIKTMFELNKHYGWSKFIVVVPSVAIREGVYKSFEMTQEHFAEEYGKKIRFFIYNSAQLTEIDRFASDSSINVMIINSQAFNAKGKDARRIYMKLDEFRSRRPIDIIAKTNPILIIDEPQSVEGKQTRERLKEFHPLLTLRYSATHKSDSIYNMVFRLDAMEAYNRRLVKKIAVKGIKVLSLFFIDEVANYREYDAAGQPVNGKYAAMFEEEYEDIIGSMQLAIGDDEYLRYLQAISASKTHAGYFSVDGKGKMVNSKVGRKETTSDDVSAYELIMRNKELLLDRDPVRSPVRFIFSHSALREGWDNPNVFQICTLKQSGSDVRKRQEVGRGLRLCVNQSGERMDTNVLGNDVHNINILTVIASESYDSFAKGLQTEMAEAVADRPRAVTVELFVGKVIKDEHGNEQVIDQATASAIHFDMIVNGYIDRKGALTDKYYEDKANGELKVAEEVADSAASVLAIIDSIYDERSMQPENARSNNVELQVDEDKLAMPEFKALWSKINAKSVYIVDFDTEELIQKAIAALDSKLRVSRIHFQVETGAMTAIQSKEELLSGASFVKEESASYSVTMTANSNVKYDLIGKLVDETGLTRKALVAILKGIQPTVFSQFKDNPEEFIVKAAALINDEKATAVIEHITYDVLDDHYGTDVFTDPTIKGRLGFNAMKAKKHLYDHIVYDSTGERDFAAELDTNTNVAVYVKLPDGFYIATPVGHYNPDWAIAFYEGSVKHIYFVAETKGSMRSMQLRLIEQSKIHCAREHFKAISGDGVVYDVVDSYRTLLEKVMR